jgi:ATP-dependent Zn protease
MIDELVGEGQLENPASSSDRAAAVVCQQDRGGSNSIEHDTGRSAIDDWRVSLHEAGHVVVGRALGTEVGGVTIIPTDSSSGLTWGPKGNTARLSSVEEVPDLCEQIGVLMPKPGECRDDVSEIYAHVFNRVTDLRAGTAAESLLYPDAEPWVAHSDIRQARKLASIICTSEPSIDAFVLVGLEEAKSLILQHRAAVLAVAEALIIHRTLDASMIDGIIASAPERARRADWAEVVESVAGFAVGLER